MATHLCFYTHRVVLRCSNMGYNQNNAESKSVEVPKGIMVPETVDLTNWNYSVENRGNRRGQSDNSVTHPSYRESAQGHWQVASSPF